MMNELENIKNQWQQQKINTEFSDNDVLQMLNKKSQNNVRNILIFSIIEFCIAITTFIFLYFTDNSTQSTLPEKYIREIENFVHYFKMYNIVYIIIFFIFVVTFFRCYKRLQISSSVKEYITQILQFRKKVNYFILLNIILFGLVLFSLFSFGLIEAVKIAQENQIQITTKSIVIISIILLVIVIFSVAILALIYRLFYGTFLIRLKKNLSELEKIES